MDSSRVAQQDVSSFLLLKCSLGKKQPIHYIQRFSLKILFLHNWKHRKNLNPLLCWVVADLVTYSSNTVPGIWILK